jgi:hypothetical protein
MWRFGRRRSVRRVVVKDGKAVGVEVIAKDGRRKRVRARNEVLLCAGVEASPKILMLRFASLFPVIFVWADIGKWNRPQIRAPETRHSSSRRAPRRGKLFRLSLPSNISESPRSWIVSG